MPGDTAHFFSGAFEQGVVDSDGDRRSRRQQPIHDQVDQHQPYRVGAPAGRGEEPMRPRVMPDPFQASTEQHPAHRAPPGLGDQPHHQTAERGEGWDGETGPEDHQHISQRTRHRAIRKHRPIAPPRVNQTPSMLPSFPPGPRTRATGVSRTITEQDHQKVRNTSNPSCFALLIDHVPAAAQAARTARVCSGDAWWWAWGRNLAAMITRRSLTVMSSKEGSVLVVYHRARDRWSAASAGACPALAYQSTVRLRQMSPNGTVRCTAARVRLRAWPTPRIWRASENATSMHQRAA